MRSLKQYNTAHAHAEMEVGLLGKLNLYILIDDRPIYTSVLWLKKKGIDKLSWDRKAQFSGIPSQNKQGGVGGQCVDLYMSSHVLAHGNKLPPGLYFLNLIILDESRKWCLNNYLNIMFLAFFVVKSLR